MNAYFSSATCQIEVIGQDNFATTRICRMFCENGKSLTTGPMLLDDGSIRASTTDGGSIPEAANVVVGDRMKFYRSYDHHDKAYRGRTWDDGTPISREDADTLILHDGIAAEQAEQRAKEKLNEVELALRIAADTAEREAIVEAVRLFGAEVWDARPGWDLSNPTDDDFWMMIPGPTKRIDVE